jgi:hypothetical protein
MQNPEAMDGTGFKADGGHDRSENETADFYGI